MRMFVEFAKEYDLTAQVASEIILNWLVTKEARIDLEISDLPLRIVARHGSAWHWTAPDPQRKKKLEISITPSKIGERGVRIHLIASIGPTSKRDPDKIKQAWEKSLFAGLWQRLSDAAQQELDMEEPQLKLLKFINQIAPTYGSKVPIERVQKEFGCKPQLIHEVIESYKYSTIKYEILDQHIRVKPNPQVTVVKAEIDGDEEKDVIDKIEIPLKFYIKNEGKFPANIFLHLNAVNLPSGKEHPPFKIKPGKTEEKIIPLSTKVQDHEYSIYVTLCDDDANRIEIPNSEIEIKINKKSSKKQKLKTIVKAILHKSVDILDVI